MSKCKSFLIEQVELIKTEFEFMDIEELFDRVLDKISKIGLIEYKNMCTIDRFDYLVDEIILDLRKA